MTVYMLTSAASKAMRGNPLFNMRLQQLAPGEWCMSAVTRS